MLLPDDEIISAIHRHERHYCHTGEKTLYLRFFLDDAHRDGGMTVTDRAARDRHVKTPYPKACDAHDDDDGDLQRLSEDRTAHYLGDNRGPEATMAPPSLLKREDNGSVAES